MGLARKCLSINLRLNVCEYCAQCDRLTVIWVAIQILKLARGLHRQHRPMAAATGFENLHQCERQYLEILRIGATKLHPMRQHHRLSLMLYFINRAAHDERARQCLRDRARETEQGSLSAVGSWIRADAVGMQGSSTLSSLSQRRSSHGVASLAALTRKSKHSSRR